MAYDARKNDPDLTHLWLNNRLNTVYIVFLEHEHQEHLSGLMEIQLRLRMKKKKNFMKRLID